MDKSEYIAEFVDIYGKLDKIAENKTSVALAIFQEIQKDRRTREINMAKTNWGTQKATEKQLDFLKRHGIEFKENISKLEASALIDERTKSRN